MLYLSVCQVCACVCVLTWDSDQEVCWTMCVPSAVWIRSQELGLRHFLHIDWGGGGGGGGGGGRLTVLERTLTWLDCQIVNF